MEIFKDIEQLMDALKSSKPDEITNHLWRCNETYLRNSFSIEEKFSFLKYLISNSVESLIEKNDIYRQAFLKIAASMTPRELVQVIAQLNDEPAQIRDF